MAALRGAAAEPLRYLDYLIHAPVRSVLLHKAGIAVTVPAPERYAVHKLMLSSLRKADDNGRQKSRKDTNQASLLLQALALERRADDVGFAWIEAWQRGPSWQHALSTGLRRLSPPDANTLAAAIDTSCAISGLATQDFGIARAATTDTKSAPLL
jgi:hypothetical protein